MKLTTIKISLFILFFFVFGCESINLDLNSDRNFKLNAKMIELNGYQLVILPAARELSLDTYHTTSPIYEYVTSEDKIKKTNFNIPIGVFELINFKEKIYGATAQSLAIYNLNDKTLTPAKFLPTPKGNFINGIYQTEENLIAITITNNELVLNTYQEETWVLTKTKSLTPQELPNSPITIIQTNNEHLAFWVKDQNLYFINLSQEQLPLRNITLAELTSIKIWQLANSLYISGFDATNHLMHYELSNLNTSLTITKTEFGSYPTFDAKFKKNDLLPIIINNALKGFIYGVIDDSPVFVSAEDKKFPSDLASNYSNKIKQLVLFNFGVFIGVIFLLSTLAYKASNAWENKYLSLLRSNFDANFIIFGPALNRGVAFLIDILVMLFISLLFAVLLPLKIDFYTQLIQWSLEPENITYREQLPLLLLAYCINILYCTSTEYFFGQTLGKYCMGLKVVSNNNLEAITLPQALLRNIIPKFPPNSLLFFASNLLIIFTQKKNSLHDLISNSSVIYYRIHQKFNKMEALGHEKP